MTAETPPQTPILLLKTRSTPGDAYEEHFTAAGYAPVFVPVLEHSFRQSVLDQVRRDILAKSFVSDSNGRHQKYGALIFTSQRAVEAFSQVVQDIRQEGTHQLDELLPDTLPLYVVGPATARGLKALNLQCPILGEETGIGDVLAALILEHYNGIYTGADKPSLLFLVGDKRRDIIPKTLQSPSLPDERRCRIDEHVIYETGEMLSFKSNFSSIWQEKSKQGGKQWVVVFSPSGCKAMLESLGFLDEETGKAKPEHQRSNDVYFATIGPTTRDYLINEFGVSPDVCAEAPTPEGVADGIKAFAAAAGW